jgi:type I restriction enzyme S subunit
VQKTVDWGDLWFVPNEYVKRHEQMVQPRDILISTANSLELVGKVVIVGAMPHAATLGAFISLIRASERIDPVFLYYQLASEEVQENFRRVASTTTNISNISSAKLTQIEVRVPPLPEQQRVVQRIEELLSRLDAGLASLRRVQSALKRYRAAVLKAACEGRLVPQDPNDEPASLLLERILAERLAKWEADLRAKGKDPKKAKYVEPAAPQTEGLPELPEGWCWATVDQLVSSLQYGTSTKAEGDPNTGVPVLRMGNIQDGNLNFAQLKYIDRSREDVKKYALERVGATYV